MNIFKSYSLVSLVATAFLISCAAIQVDPNDPNSYLIKGVPQIHQGPMQCNAASLAMIMQYHDVDISLNDVYRKLTISDSGGVGCDTMEEYPSVYHNMNTQSLLLKDPEKIKGYISKDMPIIARVISEGAKKICHYVVIVGYTDKGFIINDPLVGVRFKSYDAFQKWQKCEYFMCPPYWVLVVSPRS